MPNQDDVLINFVGDVSGLAPVDDALEAILVKEGQVGEAWKKTSAAIETQNKNNLAGTNKLAKSINDLATATKSMDKAVVGGAYAKYLKEIQNALGLTNKELVNYIQNARKAAQEAIFTAQTDKEIDELTLSIQAMNEQLELLAKTEDQAGEKTQSLRGRIREAKEELVAMADAGLKGTPAFEALQEKAGQLDDQMRDLNTSIKNVGSDTRNIEGLVSLASGVAGGFAIAQGATALFGDESEEMQKALLKVNAAMAILQGLQQIQNVLQKESAAMLLIADTRTKGLAVAQQFLAATTLESAAATGVLRTALLASGIGAIVVVLGLAAAAFSELSDKTNEAAVDTDAFAESIANLNAQLDDTINKIKRQGDLQLEYIKQRGGSEQELHNREIKNIEFESDAIAENNRQKLDAINAGLESTGIFGQGLVKNKEQAEELISSLKKISASLPDGNAQKKQIEASLDALKDVAANFEKISNNESDITLKNEQFKTKTITDALDKRKEAQKKAGEDSKAIAEKNANAIFEINKRALEREKELSQKQVDSEPSSQEFRLEGLKKFYEASNSLIELERAKELSATGLTRTQIANINDQYDKARLDATTAFGEARLNIIAQNQERERLQDEQFRAQLAEAQNAQQQGALGAVDATFKTLSANLSNAQAQRLAAAESEYKAGLISLQEYEHRREEILKESNRTEIANEIQHLKALINLKQSYGEDVTDLQKQLNDAADKLRQDDIAKHEDAEKKKTEISGKEHEMRNYLINQASQILQTGVDAIFESSAAKREAALAETLSALDAAREQELSNKNLTEEQKAEIDKKYKEKEKQEKIKAFQADKEAKRSQAVINGLLAVTNALATAPTIIAGIILAAVVAASTAIQVAKINATPVPKFRHGKVGIEGPGSTTSDSIPAMISRGESVINADATAKWKDALEAINTNKFEHYITNKLADFIFPQIPDHIKPSGGGHIDYDRLSTAIAEKMKGIMPGHKSMEFNIDKNGIHAIVVEGNSRIEHKNKRYKTN